MDESAIEPYSGRQNSWQKQKSWQKYRDQERAHTSMDVEESDSSSEVEDDDAEGVTPQVEKDFFKTLSYVKSRDPKIYDRDNTFYQSEESSSEPGEEVTSSKKQNNAKEKPMYLKDYERKIILEKGGQYSDDDSDDAGAKQDSDVERDKREASPTYVEEQQQIRDSFHKVLIESEDSESDDGLLTTKKKTKQEKNEEESDYKKWLKGETDETEEGKEMGALRTFWTDPDLDEGEKFLRNYILNKEYVSKDDQESSDSEDASDEEDADGPRFSEDEQALNDQDNFERKFNFRYEEPDADFVKRFPRTISSSVRRKDTSRKEKRKERDQRKDEEKQKKHDELKQVKNVKRREILDKLDQLREATGNAKIGFDADDLEEDFDPDKHDKMMQEIFNEEYDAGADEGVKPEFGDEFDEENYGEQDEEEYGDGSHGDDGDYGDGEELEPHCDDPDFIMDADYDPSVTKKSKKEKRESSKKKNRKNAGFGDAVKTDKPTFDPADKTFDEYMDEYYKLDYEDIIDDLPCRFKYRTVLPNDFGLTVEEVLSAKDKELNQWVSVKKASQYRSKDEEVHDIRLFCRRAKNEQFKMKVFQSFMEEKSDEDENEGEDESEDEPDKKKPDEKPEDVAEADQEEPASTSQQESPEKSSDKPVQETKKKRRRKKRNQSGPPPNEEKAGGSAYSPQTEVDVDGDDKRDKIGKLVGADEGVKTRTVSNTKQEQHKMEESKVTDGQDSENEQVERTSDHEIQAKNVKKRKRNKKNRAVGNVSGDCREKNNNTERTEQTVNVSKVGDDQESPSKKKRKNLENRQPTSSSIHESGKDITSHKEHVKPSTHVAKGHDRPLSQSGKTKVLSKNKKGPGGYRHSAGGFKGGSNSKQGHLEMFKKGGQSLRHKQQISNQRNNSKGGMTHSGTGHFTGKKRGMSHSKIGKSSPGAKEEKESKLTEDSEGKKKRNRKKKRSAGQSSDPVSKISEARLKAYGVNPKKIRFQLEYQKQKQEGQR